MRPAVWVAVAGDRVLVLVFANLASDYAAPSKRGSGDILTVAHFENFGVRSVVDGADLHVADAHELVLEPLVR